MKTHIVQQGESLYSIAQLYGITVDRLEADNNLSNHTNLSIGQAIIISEPEQIYIVQDEATLFEISDMYGVPIKQLLRYNPNVTLRENYGLYPDEELVIKYNINPSTIAVNGFVTTYVSNDVLMATLPSLTYVSILGRRLLISGDLSEANDTDLINQALAFNVAPLIFISSVDTQGKGSYAITHNVLTNENVLNNFIANIFSTIKEKGYYGVNMGLYHVLEEDLDLYVECIKKIYQRAKNEGYLVFVTCIPETFKFNPNNPSPLQHLHDIGIFSDYVILSSLLWSGATMDQVAETTPYYLKQYLDFAVNQVPSTKILIGFSRIAYDWELPYFANETYISTLSNSAAIGLANQLVVPIQFDETTLTPYFYYDHSGIEHFVWFQDSRTLTSLLNLINDYHLAGISIWNIFFYYPQTWIVISSLYNIADFEETNK